MKDNNTTSVVYEGGEKMIMWLATGITVVALGISMTTLVMQIKEMRTS